MDAQLVDVIANDPAFLQVVYANNQGISDFTPTDPVIIVRTLFRLFSMPVKDMILWLEWNGPIVTAFQAAVGRAVLQHSTPVSIWNASTASNDWNALTAFTDHTEHIPQMVFGKRLDDMPVQMPLCPFKLFCEDHRTMALRRVMSRTPPTPSRQLHLHHVAVSAELARMWNALDCVGRKVYFDLAKSYTRDN